jgi:hypothetical protein
LPSVTLGKAVAECKIAFAVCLEHTAKKLIPVVNRSEITRNLKISFGEVPGVASIRQVMPLINLLYLIMFILVTVTCSR